MSDAPDVATGRPPAEEPPDPAAPSRSTEAERRRRRADVFGDVLPDGTRDERGDGWSERDPADGSEEWLRRQVPPHHG